LAEQLLDVGAGGVVGDRAHEQLRGRDGKVRCPVHEDRTPSLHVYEDPRRGWYCFSCRQGGSVYDFAALLLGRGTRGEEFIELRRELEAILG
jgi:DNA primase